MTVQVQEIEYCKLYVHYVADPEAVEEKREEVLDQLKKAKVKVSGFRKPSSKKTKKNKSKSKTKSSKYFDLAIKQQYKDYIEKTVSKELVAEAYDESLYESKVKPIGYPEILSQNLDGDNFQCDLVFLHKPNFELSQYKDFEIPSPPDRDPVVESEKMIEDLRMQHADVLPYEEGDVVERGDSLTMDVKTEVDGSQLEDLTKQGMFYTLGQFTHPEFDNHLLGMKAGDEKSFEIMFPDEENINPSLRGKKASFHVVVHMGTKKRPHPLDDELAQKAGLEKFEDLRSQVEASASQKIDLEKTNWIAAQIVNRILSLHEFKVPSWLVLMESQRSAASKGLKWEEISDDERVLLNQETEKSVRLSLILDEIRETEPEVNFSEMELVNALKNHLITQGYDDPDPLINQMAQNGSLLGHLARIKDEVTIHWLVKNSTVIGSEKEVLTQSKES